MQAPVSAHTPRLISGGGRSLAFLEQEKARSVLQRESADAIFLLYEIATHLNVIDACLLRDIQALRIFTVPRG
jgi:hypothetical protein